MALIVICGATATGKSSLGIEIAQRLQTTLLSADSRQVYRQFDIGTAKPTVAQQQQVPHQLIDICDPIETLTVADYQQQAQALIQSMKIPLLVGGTGLYIKAIVKGLKIPRVAPQPQLRSQFQQMGQSYCYRLLQQLDHPAAEKIHPNDRVRTQRALEVYYVTGRPMSEQQGENPPNYPILQMGLQLDPEALTQRIQQRTEQMVEMGLVAEVKTLCHQYGSDLPLLKTLGYQEMIQYLQGKVSLDEAIALTVLHTRQFAKRQRTWFRAIPEIEWFNADDPDLVERVWKRVEVFVKIT